jgi:hypothetical protein
MSTQNITLEEFADLLALETQLGIINGATIIQKMITGSGLPTKIHDVRGALRLALARAGNGFAVTTYPTELSEESLLKDIGVKAF